MNHIPESGKSSEEPIQHRFVRITYWDNKELGKFSIDLVTKNEFLPEKQRLLANVANHVNSLESLMLKKNIVVLNVRPIDRIDGILINDYGQPLEEAKNESS